MTGKVVYEPPEETPEHECWPPHVSLLRIGTIWLCDDCNQYKELRNWGSKKKPEPRWRPFDGRKLRKFERKKGVDDEGHH